MARLVIAVDVLNIYLLCFSFVVSFPSKFLKFSLNHFILIVMVLLTV